MPPFLRRLILIIIVMLTAHPAHADSFADHIHRTDPPQKLPPLVFVDADNAQHALSDYRGHYVLLNVWATWCGPCVREMPSLEALQKSIAGHLTIIPLSEDRGADTASQFYFRHHITHLPVAVDNAGLAPSLLKLNGLPTTLLIDARGYEVARIEGDADWSAPDVRAYLESQIGLAPAAAKLNAIRFP